jgi:CheY-like chemotaxis protein/anti-sigma regulatory factor (Ser/Thr protein kinase)
MPLKDAGGRVIEWFGTNTDVTNERAAEAALRQLNAELDDRVRQRTAELRRLTGELAVAESRERQRLGELLHDGLQQYLVAARMWVDVLQRAGGDRYRDLHHLLTEAITASRSLTAELSPPILRKMGFVPALHWLAEWMQKTHQLTVHLALDPSAEPAEDAVKVLLFRCIRELLFNTAKHAGTLEAALEIARHRTYLHLTVADQGRGFDPSHLDASGGTGLGLASIRQRVEYLGGTVQVESAPGHGSRFLLTVPCLSPGRPALVSAHPHAGIRVLVADDHGEVHQALARLLAEADDIRVVGEAADGAQALALARQHRPDVVLMDVQMPNMDGIEATRRLRAELPEVPVIGLSIADDPHTAGQMTAAGAVAYLSKSVSLDRLLAEIRGCVTRAQAPERMKEE